MKLLPYEKQRDHLTNGDDASQSQFSELNLTNPNCLKIAQLISLTYLDQRDYERHPN